MTLVDAYGLVAFVADEPAAADVEELLRDGGCRVVVINLAEAVDVAHRVHGVPPDVMHDALDPLTVSGVLGVEASSEAEAWSAAELRRRHYHRRTRPLSMADCFLLAHALAAGEPVATADPHLAAAAVEETATVIRLP
jgi:uncharacterized protein with PIN domain